MVEADKENQNSKQSKQKRTIVNVVRIITLLGGLFWLLIFIKILQIGYLTWIGITVGTLLIVPIVISPIFGFAGMKRLEKVLSWFWGGVVILIILTGGILLIWPEGNHTWRPYRFDAEIAAVEAKWAIPDDENAALRYKSLFNVIDVKDRPGSLFRKDGAIRDELMRHPWKGEDYPEASRWLDSHVEIINELLHIGTMEKCRWPIQIKVCDEYTVPYKPLRYCMHILTVSGNRDLGEGRFQNALKKSFCLLNMAEHLYQQTDSLDIHCGFYSERTALEMIRYTLVRSDLLEDDINQIAGLLPTAANNWRQDISRLLEFEKLRFANFVSPVYEINEKGEIRFAASFWLLFDDRQNQKSHAKTNKRWRLYWLMNMPIDPNGLWDMAEVEATGLAQFLEPGPMLNIDKDDESFIDFCVKSLSNGARWTANQVCFEKHIYASFGEYYAKQMTRRRGTWLVLGLRRYRNAHGTWPDNLDAIKSYAPAEAFLDPVNDDEFVYVLDGDGFKLYSKGKNGIDENGRENDGADDWLIWPPRE